LISSVSLSVIALVIGYLAMYEPARRASLLPFLANKELSHTIYAFSYLACWSLLWRYRRKYWPPSQGQSRALQGVVVLFAVAAFPLFVGAWLATWPVWYTRYFGSPARLEHHTVLSSANLRRFRTPYVRLELETEERSHVCVEWAIDANPELPRVDRDWIGKTVCIEGKKSDVGFVMEQIHMCAAH
jgi:hypothetical protein